MSIYNDRMVHIQNKLKELPVGNITYKTIRGKKRMYLQWYEGGKKYSKYIKAAEEQGVAQRVALRDSLEKELKKLKEASFRKMQHTNVLEDSGAVYGTDYSEGPSFLTRVVTGDMLSNMSYMAAKYDRREIYGKLRDYLSDESDGKVFIIYGLRRTGKTVMMLQAISELPVEETAYIKLLSTDDMSRLNADLKKLSELGIRYVFVDEVTLMKDFVDSASLLSDVYALAGMKIVLSGTDSLGFALSMDDELYDRAITVHTTFIPFREYARLLGIHDLDEYIRYGGTFRVGTLDFNSSAKEDKSSFDDDDAARRYIDTAIARNIQHSLECYKSGGHFRHLVELYEAGELTGAINRIIEDMNHRFVLDVLERDFESHDLGSARQLDRKASARLGKTSILDTVDIAGITDKLRGILEIRNRNEREIIIKEEHIAEIKQYLFLLDLIMDCPAKTIGAGRSIEHIVFTQPGMRFCQAQALVYTLMQDELFSKYPIAEKNVICNRILDDVKERMLEDIVLLETRKVLPGYKKVFKLQFPVGEFDMVIQDERNMSCEIYEIKHSDKADPGQYRYLIDEEKCSQTEFQFGEITSKAVLYRGEEKCDGGIKYINISKYLEGLK